MEFPLFARIPSGEVYYRFQSKDEFTEWKKLGSASFIKTQVKAEDYSTTLYISDLLMEVEKGGIARIGMEDLPEPIRNQLNSL